MKRLTAAPEQAVSVNLAPKFSSVPEAYKDMEVRERMTKKHANQQPFSKNDSLVRRVRRGAPGRQDLPSDQRGTRLIRDQAPEESLDEADIALFRAAASARRAAPTLPAARATESMASTNGTPAANMVDSVRAKRATAAL